MNTADTSADTLQTQVRKIAQILDDEATEQGIKALTDKLTPLIRAQRFHNIVDLLSLLSDSIDMADDAMVQKIMKAYEDLTCGVWSLGNAARFAHNAAAQAELPSLLGLMRVAGREDVRRGLLCVLLFLGVLGRQMKDAAED